MKEKIIQEIYPMPALVSIFHRKGRYTYSILFQGNREEKSSEGYSSLPECKQALKERIKEITGEEYDPNRSQHLGPELKDGK